MSEAATFAIAGDTRHRRQPDARK